MTTLDDARTLRNILDNESSWCQFASATNGQNYQVSSLSKTATSWCLGSAISIACGCTNEPTKSAQDRFRRLNKAIVRHLPPERSCVTFFNDHALTTHNDILDVIDRTINTLEAKETHDHA